MTAKNAKVGYYWAVDKDNKPPFNIAELRNLLAACDLILERIDFEKSLEAQGPFSVIIHKMVSIIVKGTMGNARAQRYCHLLKSYIEKNPDIIMIDPIQRIESLLARSEQYKALDSCINGKIEGVFVPSYVEFTSLNKEENLAKMKENDVKFPIICKPILSQGTSYAHQLKLIFCESGLNNLKPPCIAQSFINHNARLFKMYIVGNAYQIIRKPSIKNLEAGHFPNIHFHSHICKPKVSSVLTKVDPREAMPEDLELDRTRLESIFSIVPHFLGLDLLGIDIIVEKDSGLYAIIDINIFPGYAGITNLMELFRDLIVAKLRTPKLQIMVSPSKESSTFLSVSSSFSEFTSLTAVDFAHIDFDADDSDNSEIGTINLSI